MLCPLYYEERLIVIGTLLDTLYDNEILQTAFGTGQTYDAKNPSEHVLKNFKFDRIAK